MVTRSSRARGYVGTRPGGAESRTARLEPSRQTLAAYMDGWRASAAPSLRPTTVAGYETANPQLDRSARRRVIGGLRHCACRTAARINRGANLLRLASIVRKGALERSIASRIAAEKPS